MVRGVECSKLGCGVGVERETDWETLRKVDGNWPLLMGDELQ